MGVIVGLVILALLVAGAFLIAFFWASSDGQFDDTETPAMRILQERMTKKTEIKE
ncbi:MAG: cbb3-type cytochrome oxidase assembly protein CcoS [Spirosomataceae bacterium]